MLKELRRKAGLTQKGLAEKIKTTEAAISHYENGKRTPPLNKIGLLASALNVNESDIIACFISNELKATCDEELSAHLQEAEKENKDGAEMVNCSDFVKMFKGV